jgi:peptide/nickel transport system substrate-binding protein
MSGIVSYFKVYYLLWLFAFVLTAVGCTPALDSTTDSMSNKIIYGLSITVSGIDPHINQSMELGIVLRQVYDTLVYRHPDTSEFVPGLASSWQISDDGLEYKFFLREDVVFHDGEPFNAAAVAANLDRIMAPETASQRAKLLLGTLTSYQVLDDYTISLRLSEPYAPLLDGLSQVYTGIASPKALAEYSNLRYQFHQVGTGPFIFEEYLPEDRIVIRRNPNYAWGPIFYDEITTEQWDDYVNVVEYRFFTDAATRLVALENGAADIMGELLPLDARAISNSNDLQLVPVPIPGQPLQFYMNLNQEPTNQLGLRQALILGANRSSVVDAIYGGFAPVAWGPLSAVTQYYNPSITNLYNYDPEQARVLLDTLGYRDANNDGFLERDETPLTIRVLQPPWGQLPEAMELLKAQWETLGIRVIIEPVPGYGTLIDRVTAGEFNLVAFDTPGLDPAILNPRFLSDGVVNWTGYASPELDNILREASRQSQVDLRRQLYQQAQTIIMREAIILPVRDYVNLNAHSTRIEGLVFDPYGWFPLMNNVRLNQSQ